MDYRRSVALGIRFAMRVLAALYLFGIAAVLLGIGPAWLRDKGIQTDLSEGSLVLGAVLWAIERRLNPDPPAQTDYAQPSPALIGTIVVVLTGFAAAVATGWDARTASDFAVPITILAVTIALAVPVYRFAKRHEGEIGEARFDTTER